MYKEIEGDLFLLADSGAFDVIAHQTNCFCLQGAGIAREFAKRFHTDNYLWYKLEGTFRKGDIDKLGNIQSHANIIETPIGMENKLLNVVNMYGQYLPGANTDYIALRLCLRKLNHEFKGKRIGLPQLGCGIGGGNWEEVAKIIQEELIDCDVTVVIYNKK